MINTEGVMLLVGKWVALIWEYLPHGGKFGADLVRLRDLSLTG